MIIAPASQRETGSLVLDSIDKRILFSKGLFDFNRLINNFREQLFVAFFDSKYTILHFERLAWGLGQSVSFNPELLLKRVSDLRAESILFAHNHPDGDATPSLDDAVSLRKIEKLLINVGATVADSIIITKEGYYSFEETGRLEGIKSRAFSDFIS